MTATASRRPARINPDTLPVLIVAAALTTGLIATSFALTFAALLDVAAWANVTPRLAWAVPVMLDAAIVVYTLAVLVHRARHESALTAWLPLAGFTGVSVLANAAHAGAVPVQWQAIIGTLVAGLAPVAVLLATHTLARLIVAPVINEAETGTETDTSADSERHHDTDTRQRTEIDDSVADSDDRRTGDAGTPGPSAPFPVAAVVRHHKTPQARRAKPRTSVRAADCRDDILRLRDQGLSVRAIAERVGLGKTAVANLVSSEAQAA